MVIGGPGTGKSHLARYLAENVRRTRGRVGLISADPGQPSLGVPTCAALALEPPWKTPEAMWFVGDVSPRGHLLQTVVGTARLAARARDGGAATAVIDPSGLAQGALGSLLKYHKAVAAGVDEVVAIQLDAELEPLLALLSGPCRAIHRLAPVAEATDRSRDERRAYREARFRAHLTGGRTHSFARDRLIDVDWSLGSEPAAGTVVGLIDRAGFCLGIGLLEPVRRGALAVYARWRRWSAVEWVQVGRPRLTRRGEMLT